MRYDLDHDMNVVSDQSAIKEDAQSAIKEDRRSTDPLRAIKHYIYFNTMLAYPVLNFLYDLTGFGKQLAGEWSYFLVEHSDRWTYDESEYNEYIKAGVMSMEKYMNKLLKLLRRNEIDLTIAVYPWPSQVWHEALDSRHVRIWKKWSHENNIKFINYFPDLVKLGISRDEKIQILKNYYIPGDGHFNRRGNKLIAKKFLEFYRNKPAS